MFAGDCGWCASYGVWVRWRECGAGATSGEVGGWQGASRWVAACGDQMHHVGSRVHGFMRCAKCQSTVSGDWGSGDVGIVTCALILGALRPLAGGPKSQ